MSNISYRSDIDGIRAIAVLSVVLFHLFPNVIPGGFAGVDVFFVISGYLITSIIVKDLNQNKFSVVDFYARRARRIFPALAVVLIACLIVGWFLLLPDEYSQIGFHTFAGSIFTSNLILWSEAGYFDLESISKPLLHLWSLGVEEQFYLIWPLMLWASFRFGLSLGLVVVCVGLLSFSYSYYASLYSLDAAFYSPVSRFWQLAAGGVLAIYQHRRDVRNPFPLSNANLQGLYPLVGIVLLTISFFTYYEGMNWPGIPALLPTLGTILLLAGTPNSITKLILSNKVMVFIGSISFSLYLCHWPLISLHYIVKNSLHRDAAILIFILSVILAYLTTRFIERPLRFNSRPSSAAILVTIVLALVGSSGMGIYLMNGFPDRGDPVMNQLNRDLAGGVTLPSPSTNWCNGLNGGFCTYQGAEPSVALIGDSHARAIYFGLRDLVAQENKSLAIIGKGGCAPYIKDPADVDTSCISVMLEAVDKVVGDVAIKTVYINYRNSRYFTEKSGLNAVFSDESIQRFSPEQLNASGLSSIIQTLIDADKSVVFLWDVPNLGFSGRSCLPRSGLGVDWAPEKCVVSRSSFENELRVYAESVQKVLSKYPQVQQIKLYEALCDSDKCIGATAKNVLYTDEDHLSISGSKYVVEVLSAELKVALGN